MNVLKKINQMRLARGWSVYHLAVAADLPQSTLINMMNRETLPSLTTLERICAAFGVTLSELFREAEEGEASESRQAECLRLFGQLPRETQELALSLLRELSKGDGKS